ncbi:Acyl carrier protein (modular protein) [Verrucomicrobia bacterium]|nr:Acyl carrier protein (modular protein) [Verrucomicrobiota bacterium]
MNNILSDQDTQAVLDILVEQLGVQEPQLTPDARLQEDLGADSLDIVEIIMTVDERFDISVPDEVAERVSTVGDLFDTLAQLLEKRGGPQSSEGRRPRPQSSSGAPGL